MNRSKKIEFFFMAFIAIVCWFALLLQLWLIIQQNVAAGNTPLYAILNFFSFFTVLTNLLVAISLTAVLLFPASKMGVFFSNPKTQSAIAVYISIVGIVYSVALRHIWNPQGLQLVADRLLHDVVPVLYIIYWLIFIPKKILHWKDPFPWLLYPILYIIYAITRGVTTGWFAYPFINTELLPNQTVAFNCLLIAAAFLIVGLLFVLINKSFKIKGR